MTQSVIMQVLVLSETIMLKWREDVLSKIGHLTGERLELRSGGLAAQLRFMSQVIDPTQKTKCQSNIRGSDIIAGCLAGASLI